MLQEGSTIAVPDEESQMRQPLRRLRDLRLPGMNGCEVPSAHTESAIAARLLAFGAAAELTKPGAEKALIEAIRTTCAQAA